MVLPLLPSRDRTQLPDKADDGWTDGHENDRRQNKQHQGRDHLDGRFGGLLFGSLTPFRAEGVGMHAEGLSDAGSEAVGLYQCTNKRTNVVNPSAVHQVTESIRTRLPGAHLQIDQVELVAEVGMGMMQVLATRRMRC